MSRVERFKIFIWNVCHAVSPGLEHRLKSRFLKSYWANWHERTRQVAACPDNEFIPRVPAAGRVVDGIQIMHNGLKVRTGSYYGKESTKLLQRNRGVHEPQEERVFQEVLKHMRGGAAMVELGAYWGFYSMWFCNVVPNARAFLVEPIAENLAYGKENFALNGLRGHFTHAWVGAASGSAPDGTATVCVDDLIVQHQLEEIAILHSDIQGAELDMLRGTEKSLGSQKVLFTFISTHSEEIHVACDRFLQARGYLLLASIRPSESYSMDGVLVHSAPGAPKIPVIALSRKPARR